MTTKIQEAQEQEEQKIVTISHDKELDLLILSFSQDLVIAHELVKEIAAFRLINKPDGETGEYILDRKQFMDFIKYESSFPVLTRAVPELQVEFAQYTWNYILQKVDEKLATKYQATDLELLTLEEEHTFFTELEEETEEIVKRCLYPIANYTCKRANEYVQEQKHKQSEGENK